MMMDEDNVTQFAFLLINVSSLFFDCGGVMESKMESCNHNQRKGWKLTYFIQFDKVSLLFYQIIN